VSDAWIYSSDLKLGDELAIALSELGYAPRRPLAGAVLAPPATNGSAARIPGLAVVVGGEDEPAPVEIYRRLRAHSELGDVPVVMSVDSHHLAEAPRELAEADALLVRPFRRSELEVRLARIRRETRGAEPDEVVRSGTLELRMATYEAFVDEEPVAFAYMEYELLKFLMTHANRAFPREALLNHVWGYDYYGSTRTVDVHVRRIRAKIGEEHAAHLKTIRSVGYRFDL